MLVTIKAHFLIVAQTSSSWAMHPLWIDLPACHRRIINQYSCCPSWSPCLSKMIAASHGELMYSYLAVSRVSYLPYHVGLSQLYISTYGLLVFIGLLISTNASPCTALRKHVGGWIVWAWLLDLLSSSLVGKNKIARLSGMTWCVPQLEEAKVRFAWVGGSSGWGTSSCGRRLLVAYILILCFIKSMPRLGIQSNCFQSLIESRHSCNSSVCFLFY